MTKKIIYALVLICSSFHLLSAQTTDAKAAKVIDDLIKSVKNNTVQADFTLTVMDEYGDESQVQKGTFTMKKDRFRLKTDEIDIIFDGKTQWSYSSLSNEVSITEPSEDEAIQSNPLAIISAYRDNCNIIFSRHETSPSNYVVVMMPATPGADFQSIDVQVNKSNSNLASIRLTGNDGEYTVLITFTNFSKGVSVPDNAFVFQKNSYPGVFENDLR